MIRADLSFPAAYHFEVLEELPSRRVRRFYFPGGHERGGRDGVLVHVVPPSGDEWIGVFAFGDVSPKGVSSVHTCPRSSQLCVVARGQGYFTCVENPAEHEQLSLLPVLRVIPVPSRGLIVFHDFTRFVAYGQNGIAWKTPSISWDGLAVERTTGRSIQGKAWDAASGRDVEFELDLEDGKYQGGASPPSVDAAD